MYINSAKHGSAILIIKYWRQQKDHTEIKEFRHTPWREWLYRYADRLERIIGARRIFLVKKGFQNKNKSRLAHVDRKKYRKYATYNSFGHHNITFNNII